MSLFRFGCSTLFSRVASTSQAVIVPCLGSAIVLQNRTATKRGGGSTRNGRDSAGRRLGIKKSGGQAVIPGNIILRQRGYSWHPGPHVGVGKDHTLYALTPGFVRFYKATKEGSSNRSERKFCGVVLDQAETLPRLADQPRSRYFGGMDLTAFEELLETARQSKQGLAAPAQA